MDAAARTEGEGRVARVRARIRGSSGSGCASTAVPVGSRPPRSSVLSSAAPFIRLADISLHGLAWAPRLNPLIGVWGC